MKKSRYVWIVIVSFVLLSNCTEDIADERQLIDSKLERAIANTAENGRMDFYQLPGSNDFGNIPHPGSNPLTAEKVELGRFLFFETALALNPMKPEGLQTWSCATCHVPDAGFMPGTMQGIADGGMGFGYSGEERTKRTTYEESELDAQGARAISVLNAAYIKNAFWNGQFGSKFANEGTEHLWNAEDRTLINHEGLGALESQNIEALDIHRMVINKDVADRYGLTPYFDKAFPDIPATERYSLRTGAFAISSFLRTLLPNQAPFQKWLKGEKQAMSEKQKRGALIFFSKAQCTNCHNSPGFNSVTFHAVGANDMHMMGGLATSPDDRRNLGRAGFTKEDRDLYKFKVPQLYNLKNSPFYFHGSSKRSLQEVVEYFNKAEAENPNVTPERLSPYFTPLQLTPAEMSDLVEFLKNGLYDPQLDRYVPDQILSGFCFPNNDERSRNDMGCN